MLTARGSARTRVALPFFSVCRTATQIEMTMPSFINSPKPLPAGRIEREIERERQEHSLNQDAKQHLGESDERLKDARETSFSSAVRRLK
ncbi:MAG: hypothetical protein JWP59_2458 [Massilia sp.]|nr:hypothetical protein [Massilia sp.]